MSLDNNTCRAMTFQDRERPVYVQGTGPAVIVMHELPGMTPECLALGDRLAANGFTVYLPLFFGKAGQKNSNLRNVAYFFRFCISAEWAALARGRTSPVADWVRDLCRTAHNECGGPGVGAIGMCLTGSFAIPLMLDEAMLAPIVCQPALPFGFTASQKRDLGVSPDHLREACRRSERENVTVLGYRFTHDRVAPPEKFITLRNEFGERFQGHEISSEPGNPHGIRKCAHSVLTADYCHEAGHPTREAFDRIVRFLTEQLKSG